VNRSAGAEAISLRVLEFSEGVSPGIRNEDCDEVLYVAQGDATVFIDGWSYSVSAETGIYLRPGATFTLVNRSSQPTLIVSSRCPEPLVEPALAEPITKPAKGSTTPVRPPTVRLADREAVPTLDRWYRVLVDEEVGSSQVTQFVGSIPPGRAPDHSHEYEEVLFILNGVGRLWTGASSAPISAGSCIYLPKRQIHCVENTGMESLQLLGVFYPAGSPGARNESDL
jgi:mannose-6-phosphate isomerase-like protein (cupin superfamily)